jgi:dolichol-phosphate mannosyltransferase
LAINNLLKINFVRFCLVGTTGFIINYSLLTIQYKFLKMPIFISQLFSSEISLFSNFLLHHKWTYKRKKTNKSLKILIVQFHASSWVAIIGSTLAVSIMVNLISLNYVIALAISSLIALVWNFAWTNYVVWHHDESKEKAKEEI